MEWGLRAKMRPHSQWYLGDFFPNLEKNSQSDTIGMMLNFDFKSLFNDSE